MTSVQVHRKGDRRRLRDEEIQFRTRFRRWLRNVSATISEKRARNERLEPHEFAVEKHLRYSAADRAA